MIELIDINELSLVKYTDVLNIYDIVMLNVQQNGESKLVTKTSLGSSEVIALCHFDVSGILISWIITTEM